jgi:cytoskeletal protein RodZ
MYDARDREQFQVPGLAFHRAGRHDVGRRSAEVGSMKDDRATELEALLRDALNSGAESPRGKTPILQLKTMPVSLQDSVVPTPAAAPAVARAVEPPAPESSRLVSESVPPKPTPVKAKAAAQAKRNTSRNKVTKSDKRGRSSLVAVLSIGLVALGAAGSAAWVARKHRTVAVATVTAAETAAPAVTGAPPAAASEGAVGIQVASRPAETKPAEAPKVDEAKAAAAAAAPVSPAAPVVVAPVVAAPVVAAKIDVKPEPKAATPRETPPAAPAPKPVVHHSAVAKAEKPAAAEKPPVAEKPAAAPAPQPASVDAILQQQLKGAIP